MASTPLPAYGVHVRSFYIRKHFKDCTSRSFPDDWTHLENVMLLLPRFKIVSLSTCAREVALANAHPGPFPQISFWRTGLPIHTGTHLYPKPGKQIHVAKPHRRKISICIRCSGRFLGVLMNYRGELTCPAALQGVCDCLAVLQSDTACFDKTLPSSRCFTLYKQCSVPSFAVHRCWHNLWCCSMLLANTCGFCALACKCIHRGPVDTAEPGSFQPSQNKGRTAKHSECVSGLK